MRLDKLLANLGYASRKDLIEYFKRGAIKVNGIVVKDRGLLVDPERDVVSFLDEELFYKESLLIMMNKPKGYISSNVDELYPSVLNLLPPKLKRLNLNIAGRLDQDTEGLLLLTNDGDILHSIISPHKNIDKVYLIETLKPVDNYQLLLEEMTILDGNNKPYKTRAKNVEKIASNSLYLTISEGKYHQVKRMIETLDNKVINLKRVKVGLLKLPDDLATGSYREIKKEMIFGNQD